MHPSSLRHLQPATSFHLSALAETVANRNPGMPPLSFGGVAVSFISPFQNVPRRRWNIATPFSKTPEPNGPTTYPPQAD